jgi:inosine-uridine nucleoside N-ribohydrolase
MRIVVDTDPGVDDALALILALRSPEVVIDAITCATGNLPADGASENARRILDLAQAPEIPVSVGSLAPLARPWPSDPFSHGDDGLANTGLPASSRVLDERFGPDVLVETVMAHPGEVTIVALAPLTNVALALRKEPRMARTVRRIIATAGSFGFNEYAYRRATGDNPCSEWNVYVDPEAARVVFHSGAPVTAVGVDAWGRPEMDLTPSELAELAGSADPAAQLTHRTVDFVTGRGYGSYTALIDALTMAAAIDPSILRTERVRVDVEVASPLTLGQTVTDRRDHHAWAHLPEIEVAIDADYRRFRRLLLHALTGRSGAVDTVEPQRAQRA